MSDNLIKHSQRTVRKGCKYCGRKDLYWAHDNSRPEPDRFCGDCGSDGKWILVDRNMNPHDDVCPGRQEEAPKEGPIPLMQRDNVPETPFTLRIVKNEEDVDPPVTATPDPLASTTIGGADAAFNAFQAMVASMAPQVDEQTVRAIVKEQLDQVIFPTKTVIVREKDGETKVIEGAHERLADVTTFLLAGLHVMMVGPAGTGKSTLAEQAAESLGLPHYSLSLSPQTPTSALLGYMNATGDYVGTLYRQAFEHGGVFHFDEIDNSHPSVLAVVNAGLANGYAAFPDGMVKRHDDFRCVASANTYGRGADRQYVGRQAMDAATLDRFAVITVNVDEILETQLCMNTGLRDAKVIEVLTFTRKLRKNAVDKGMRVIVSPRASIGMCKLLEAGVSWKDAAEAVVYKGISDQDKKKLNG